MSEPTEATSQLRVLRGSPSPEELAALVVVLAARTQPTAGTPVPEPQPARSAWGSPAAALRRMPPPGPGAWRASMRPG